MSGTRPKAQPTERPIPPEKLLQVLAVIGDPAYGGKLTLAKIHRMQRRMLRAQIQRQRTGASSDGT